MIRKVILRYLQFRKNKLVRNKNKTVLLAIDIHKHHSDGRFDILEFHKMMDYQKKTLENIKARIMEVDKIIKDAESWHIVRKQKKNS